ncbi:MAG: serine--tRNA ligase, partial [Holosporaceae bacterium]|nr:serine--tRNA ligase [Holosporaceae bacterium]
MHDIKWIRENRDFFDKALQDRNFHPISNLLIEIDTKKREVASRLQLMQARRNELASIVGQAKAQKETVDVLEQEATSIRQTIQQLEAEDGEFARQLSEILSTIPNIALADVPIGKDETTNKCIRVVGDPTKFDFKPRAHYEIGELLGMIDFPNAAKISGSRFTILRGPLARMERALKSFMLDSHIREFGYEEINVPYLVKSENLYGTGQLPKFAEDLFVTTDDRWLIPTAEVPLTNIVRDTVIPVSELPIRLTAYSSCFRSEAGAAGRDNRGMIRNHQFSKVELVSIVHPDKGEEELERMTRAAEKILQKLELPYR